MGSSSGEGGVDQIDSESLSAQLCSRFLAIWSALSAICLMGVSAPLWFPSFFDTGFPSIPLFEIFLPVWLRVDTWLSILLIGILLVWFLPFGRLQVIGLLTTAFISGALVCLDQHRLQPWFYQLFVFSLVFAVPDSIARLKFLRWIVISVYIYSALGKVDFEFTQTVGQQFLDAVLQLLGIDPGSLGRESRFALVSLFPASELLLGLGLLWPRTRVLFGMLACLFHLLLAYLFAAVLEHSYGVILWNIQFAVQAVLLFSLPRLLLKSRALRLASVPSSGESVSQLAINSAVRESAPDNLNNENSRSSSGYRRFVACFVACVIALPLGERFGVWDHWLSWALYAPHSSRVNVYVATTFTSELPDELQSLLGPSQRETEDWEGAGLWVRIPIEKWSLEEKWVPVYPQARFQMGVARAMVHDFDPGFAIKTEVLGVSGRLGGERDVKELVGSEAVEDGAKLFFWNTTPRVRN